MATFNRKQYINPQCFLAEEIVIKMFNVDVQNGTEHYENGKQLLTYKNYLLLRDIWW